MAILPFEYSVPGRDKAKMEEWSQKLNFRTVSNVYIIYIYIYSVTSYLLSLSSFLFLSTIAKENRSKVKRGIKFEEFPSSSSSSFSSWRHGASLLFEVCSTNGRTAASVGSVSTPLLEERQYACKEHLDPLLRLERPFRTRQSGRWERYSRLRGPRVSGKLSPWLGNFVIISPPPAVNTV